MAKLRAIAGGKGREKTFSLVYGLRLYPTGEVTQVGEGKAILRDRTSKCRSISLKGLASRSAPSCWPASMRFSTFTLTIGCNSPHPHLCLTRASKNLAAEPQLSAEKSCLILPLFRNSFAAIRSYA